MLVVGGSWGKAGAPAMASLAALRTGAGLVTAAVPERIVGIVAGVAPELMVAPLWKAVVLRAMPTSVRTERDGAPGSVADREGFAENLEGSGLRG